MKDSSKKKLTRNRCQCDECKDIIESTHVHDYVTCKCGAIAVDGGLEYIRRVGQLHLMVEMNEYDEGEKDENVVNKSNKDVSETPVRGTRRNAHVLRRLKKRNKRRRLSKE